MPKILLSHSLSSCFSFSHPFTATSFSVMAVFIYLFSHLFLSPHLILLISQSFTLQIWWQGPGCDPITGWLQQSRTADWFYNPRWGPQMGENQLTKKWWSESCHTDAHTYRPRQTWANVHTKNTHRCYSSLLANIHLLEIPVIAFTQKVSYQCVWVCVCVFGYQ